MWIVTLIALMITDPVAAAGKKLSAKTREATVLYAKARLYRTEDVGALVDAVGLMAQTVKPKALTRCTTPLTLVEGGRRHAAMLLVNPVCGECDRVLDLFRKMAKETPDNVPTILAGEVPSSEDASREAVALLRTLTNEPDTRAALLQELLVRQPTTAEAVRTIARGYMPALTDERELGRVHDEPPCAEISTPVLIYRDRLLQRTRSGRVTFDPMRNEDSIRLALDAVDDLQSDGARSDRGGQAGSVCDNATLSLAIRIMDGACSTEFCDPQQLRQLEKLSRPALLGALRDPYLMPVHIFFPRGKARLTDAFDWTVIKKDQLRTISNLNDPEGTGVFILSHSGGSSVAGRLARDRAYSVYFYLRNVLGVKCRYIKGVLLGMNTLRLRAVDAKLLGLTPRDYRNDPRILNQAVHVFIYPCATRMVGD